MLNAGKLGEDQACRYLRNHGYKVLTRNYHSRFGEIDIVARKDGSIVFVEVKTRSSSQFGTPREAVNYFKLQKMIKTAHIFLKIYGMDTKPFQFDVIEVIGKEEPFEISHVKNVTL